MNRINTLLRQDETRDSGFTLIEVLVAMMVFAIISVIVAYSLTLSMTMTRNSRASEVAANLAAQQVDVARATPDVFDVTSGVVTQTLDGTTYTITKSVGWVNSAGAASDCGSGSGILQNKTLNVSVTWDGKNPSTTPVQASTLLAPAGPINDPTTGTIIVHVTNAAGQALPGVPVAVKVDTTVSPNTATAVSTAPDPTDSDGCSYVLKVTPGTYVVTVGKTGDGRISSKQVQVPSAQTTVTAGQSSVLDVQYDTAATPAVTLSPGAPVGTMFPTSLPMTYAPQGDAYSTSVSPVTLAAVTTATTPLFPWGSGYSIFAGQYVPTGGGLPQCLSVDPGQWVSPNASGNVGQRPTAVGVTAGSAPITVAMPVIRISTSSKWIVAVSATAATAVGDPGCSTGMTLRYGQSPAIGGVANVALPYGSWKIYALSNQTDALQDSALVDKSKITLPAGSPPFTGTNILTIDPRLP